MPRKPKAEEAETEETSEEVVLGGSARPNDVPLPNSTFADRAKALGKNKRVESSQAK